MTAHTLFGTDLRTIESVYGLAVLLNEHAPNGFTRGLVKGPYVVDVIDDEDDTNLFVHNGTEWLSVFFDETSWTPLQLDYAPYRLPYEHREFQSKDELIQYLDGQLTVPTTPVYANAQDLCNDILANNGTGKWLWDKGIHGWEYFEDPDSSVRYYFVYDHGTWYRLTRIDTGTWRVAGDNIDGKFLRNEDADVGYESPREFIERVSVARGYTDYKVPMNYPVSVVTYSETESVTLNLEHPITMDGDGMATFEGGGVRSSDEGKPRFDLLLVSDVSYLDQVLTRAADRMAEGAMRYGDKNHERMEDVAAFERAKSSLFRHVMQYLNGETDEDHAAAIVCNVIMAEGIAQRAGE